MTTTVAEPHIEEEFAVEATSTWSAIPLDPIPPVPIARPTSSEQADNHAALFAIDENRRGTTLSVEQSDVG